MKMKQTDCSKSSTYKTQMLANYQTKAYNKTTSFIANLLTPIIRMDHLEVQKEGGSRTACLTQDTICEVASTSKCSNEHLGSIECREFLDYM